MIDKYSFGRITIDGQTYGADVLIYPDHVDDRWRRKEAHRLEPADLKNVCAIRPTALVIGTGYFGMMHIDPTVSDMLQQQGITLVACDTTRACAEFNRLKDTRRVVAALHLTC